MFDQFSKCRDRDANGEKRKFENLHLNLLNLHRISGENRAGISYSRGEHCTGGVSAWGGRSPHNGGFLNARSFAKESAKGEML